MENKKRKTYCKPSVIDNVIVNPMIVCTSDTTPQSNNPDDIEFGWEENI